MSEQEKKEEVKVEVQAEIEQTEVQATTDDAKRTGIKDVVVDSEAVAIEKEKQVESEKVSAPSFFVNEQERRKVEVDVLSVKETGKIVSVSRVGMGLDFDADFPFLTHKKVCFEFTVPTYEDMSSYRQRCGIWRREANQMLVDRLQLRNFFLVWHLKDWDLTDRDGKKIELVFDKDGSLNTESLRMVYSMQSVLVDVVLTAFEKDILLI
jgi:hypothetical protein